METDTKSDAARIEALEARLSELENRGSTSPRGWFGSIIPPEATRHFRNASRENLLGMRSLVDFWIRRLDGGDAQAAATTRIGREEIAIE